MAADEEELAAQVNEAMAPVIMPQSQLHELVHGATRAGVVVGLLLGMASSGIVWGVVLVVVVIARG